MEWRTVFWHMLQWAFVGGLSEDGVHDPQQTRFLNREGWKIALSFNPGQVLGVPAPLALPEARRICTGLSRGKDALSVSFLGHSETLSRLYGNVGIWALKD